MQIASKIFAFFFSIFMAFTSATLPEVTPMEVEPDENFVPVVRFVAASDSHIEKLGDKGCVRFMKMLETGYAAAEADPNYDKLDAAVLVGDITNSGLPHMFFGFKAALDASLRDGTEFLGVVAKNHDSYAGRISRFYINGISGNSADCHKVINGFHFITLSASPTSLIHYTKAQIKWLDKQLAEATADDPAKPVFVFQHEHIYDTVYGSYPEDGWGVKQLTDTLNKYPQVIDISGHSHYPANDPRAIWQDTFTAINDGSLNYYEFTIDGATSQHPESSSNMAQMLLVEVDAQNRVKVRVCDMTAECVLAEYMIDNVADEHKTKYSQDVRRENAVAPVFENAPEITVDGQNVKIKSAPAVPGEDDVVFIYRLTVTDAVGNTVASQKKLGDYYKTPVCSDVEFSVNGLQAGDYGVSLVAEDAWGKVSAPVTASFTVVG